MATDQQLESLGLPVRLLGATALFGLALGLRLVALPVEAGVPFIVFAPATVLAFYLFGSLPGALNLLLSAVAGFYAFSPPYLSFGYSPTALWGTAGYLVGAGAAGWIVARLRSVDQQRRATLARLAERDAQLSTVLDSQTDLICRFRADGTVLYVNLAYCKFFGVDRDNIVGQRWQPIALPDDLPRIEASLAQLSPSEPVVVIENRVIATGGEVRWCQFVNRADFGPDGRCIELQAVGRDITERKMLEAELAESHERVRDLFDNAPCGYHALDAGGRFLQVNATEARWLGSTPEALIGRHAMQYVDAAGQAQFAQQYPRLLAGESIGPLVYSLVGPGIAPRQVSVRAEPRFGADGQFLSSRTVMHDITELQTVRLANMQLLATQAAMLDNDLIGILRLKDRRAVWKNRALDRIFGYAPGELDGQPTRVLYLSDDDHAQLGAAAYPVLARGERFRTQMRLRRKNGSAVWIELSGAPLDLASDESLWLMADISHLKQAEELRARKERVDAENHHLQAYLRQQKVFLSNMTHELRTPLNAVLGYGQLLQTPAVRADPARVARYAELILHSGRLQLDLIERLLELTRSSTGRLRLQPEAAQLDALVDEVVQAHQASAAARRITLQLEPAAAPLPATFDVLRVRQVVGALLSNAIRFSHEGGRVTVRLSTTDEDQLLLEVLDEGPGIAEADRPKLFQDFRQLSQGHTRSHGGTGIGLALVRRLVEAHGGRVGVDSVPSLGSTFYVVLPRQPVLPLDDVDAEGDPAAYI